MEPTRSSCRVLARALWSLLILLGLLASVPGLTAYADGASYALTFDEINDQVLLPEARSIMGAAWGKGETAGPWIKPT